MRFTCTANSTGRLRAKAKSAALAALIFSLLVLRSAQAHPVAQGRLEIEILPEKIRARAIVSTEEVVVQNTLGSNGREGAVAPEELYHRHALYLLQHLRFIGDNRTLAGRVVTSSVPDGRGLQHPVYDFEFDLPTKPARVRVEQDVLNEFTYAPGNRWEATYVTRVAQQGQPAVEALLFTSREPLLVDCVWSDSSATTVPGPALVDRWRLTRAYVWHGLMHILTGYDHLLFIGALALAVVTLWDLIKVISVFTLAHSLTLTLSVLNLVRLPGRIVEPMIAASIIFVALQNVLWPARSRGAARLGVAFFFGLFHGLGFAGGLLAAMEGMAGLTVGLAILAFSIGIELGHQIVVLPIFGLLKTARTYLPSPMHLTDHVVRYGSLVISAAGLFYLIIALR